ncbi:MULTISPECIES: flagellin [Priestia]|uniref:flagellin N-terminal helical domain-containing protein n=1 Tax=Priestia TaxID=2800373 RepID=UPI001F12A691|nr:flagellin [Priestia megaterium]UMZ34173.1 flagellin [Priestia megaterium]
MRINHNITALNTYRQFNSANNAQSKSMEKLSSGLRINSAADDAAGLAISEKMRGQIRGLDQASSNAQDSISLIQTAEGALNETHDILQRMRELSVQSANDTNTADDRAEIQKEVDQLKEEVNRISDTTEFNTKKLLNGNVASTATVSGTNTAKIDTADVTNAKLASGVYTLTVENTANIEITDEVDAGTGIQTGDITATAANAKYGQYQVKVSDDAENAGRKVVTLINSANGEEVGSQSNVDYGTDSVTLGGFDIDTTNGTGNGTYSFEYEGDHDFKLADADGNTIATQSFTDLNKSEVEIAGVKVSFNGDIADGSDTTITIANNSLATQIGANKDQTMNININDMSAKALGVNDLDVTSQTGAETAIKSLDSAIKSVSGERSKLGAFQNRLEHTINNLNTSSENLTASESRIRDVDYALAA